MKKFLIVLLVLIPLNANAFIFALFPALAASAGLTTSAAVALDASIAIHTALLSLKFYNDAQKTNNTITVQLDPNTPLIQPPNWRAPASGSNQPLPPLLVSASVLYQWDAARPAEATPEAAFAKFKLDIEPLIAPAQVTFISFTLIPSSITFSRTGSPNAVLPITLISNCPAGYSLTTPNQCGLSDSQFVMKPSDDQCELFVGTDKAVHSDPADPDCTNSQALAKSLIALDPDGATITDKQTGEVTKLKINPDGSKQMINSKPNASGNTDKTTIDTDPSNFVTGVKSETLQGTGTLATSTPSSTPPALDISSLNKESTQQQINSKLSSIDGTATEIRDLIKCDACVIPPDQTNQHKVDADSEIKKSTDKIQELGTQVSSDETEGLWGTTWLPTFPTGTCSPFVGIVHGASFQIDPCFAVEKINALIGYLYALFGAWSLLSLLTNPRGGSD